MNRQLETLEPVSVFRFFREIAAIPHGSYHTDQISNYLVDFAKERGLEYYQDDDNNVVIIKEATKGYEKSEPVIIQGHMDMVCEKAPGATIDFEKDGLDLYVEDGYLKARGTTLGGDDGVAIAYGLSILDSKELEHPRIEFVVTNNEEVGMLGATSIDLSMLQGHILLNIDSDVEGEFLMSCAGGASAYVEIPVERCNIMGMAAAIHVGGLLGGHSGVEIHKEHASAIMVMGRVLREISNSAPMTIASLQGGMMDNAIPRETDAIIVFPAEAKDTIEAVIAKLNEILKKEYLSSDPDIEIKIDWKKEKEYEVITPGSTQKVLFYLRNVPNGVMHMSTNVEGLVETSLNAGIMKLTQEAFTMRTSLRSSVGSRRDELQDRMTYLTEFLGGTISMDGLYPAWEYNPDSTIRELAKEVYVDLFHETPVFNAIHAGLECGILSEKIPNLDAISFGPENLDIHTPDERLNIASTKKIYEFLVELLKRMKV